MNRKVSNGIKEQYEKREKFVGTLFLFSQKRKPVLKEKTGMKKEWLRKKRVERWKRKNLGGDKKEK